GAVLFETLTGTRAFGGDNAARVRTAVLEEEPPAVSSRQPHVPAAVNDIVRRCLAKNPQERWQSASEVVRDLKEVQEAIVQARRRASISVAWRWVAGVLVAFTAAAVWMTAGGYYRGPATTTAGPIRSIAVMPLENLSGDPEQEYFADGMTDQLIGDMARI